MNLYRPSCLNEYIGQEQIKQNLLVAIEACRIQETSLPHILLFGPSGMGKTSLALLVSRMLESRLHVLHGPNLQKPSDVIATLTQLKPFDIVFIDEIHAMERMVEEALYPVMEDNTLNIVIGKDYSSKNVCIDLPKFTMLGATTMVNMVNKPLLDRFNMTFHLKPYSQKEIAEILNQAFCKWKMVAANDDLLYLAKHCRANPRIAVNLATRIHEYILVKKPLSPMNRSLLAKILRFLNVHYEGLTELELAYLRIFKRNRGLRQTCSLNYLGQCLNEPLSTIVGQVEPYLLVNDYIVLTTRGRMLSVKTQELFEHHVIDDNET